MPNASFLLGCLALSLMSVSPLGLADGEATFQQYCSGCHGADGGGTPGLAQVATHVITDINGVAVDVSAEDVEAFRSERVTHAALKALRNGSGDGDG